MARSLSVSSTGAMQATQMLANKGLNQKELAVQIGLARSSVSKFFTGKPVDRQVFVQICTALGLDWQSIVENSEETETTTEISSYQPPSEITSLPDLVREIRAQIKTDIQERCGWMRVLDMRQPIELCDIYTDVNILERIQGHEWRDIEDLMQGCTAENFDRFCLGRVTEARVLGEKVVAKYPRLTVYGKPGSGKTTFLKYLAISCISGRIWTELVPIFIMLKDFAEAGNSNLIQYIAEQFQNCKIKDAEEQVDELLYAGKALILLDGLDEVKEEDSKRVITEIQKISTIYPHNRYVITCRIAAKEYTFERFTDVEIANVEVADFSDKQIETFVTKWFETKNPKKGESFLSKLEINQPIRELANSPLLLTLLCLVFEENGNFPKRRSELYQEAIAILLKKWDGKRGIERDEIYRELTTKRKEDLLSYIAKSTFEKGRYFFRQPEVERYITEYLSKRNFQSSINQKIEKLSDESNNTDSLVILKSIESQHGLLVERAKNIYSFSHLTFQEYFTAKKIVTSFGSRQREEYENLLNKITERRWREVFLLLTEMLVEPDEFLWDMKKRVDALVKDDAKIQQILQWIYEKSSSISHPYKPACCRTTFIESVLERKCLGPADLLMDNRKLPYDLKIDYYLTAELGLIQVYYTDLQQCLKDFQGLDYGLERAIDNNFDKDSVFQFKRGQHFDRSEVLKSMRNLQVYKLLKRPLEIVIEPELKAELQRIKAKLPDTSASEDDIKTWLDTEGKAWADELRKVLNQYRNICHDWQLDDNQYELIKKYYNANLLLVDCVNSDCDVSRETKEEIINTLLLPADKLASLNQNLN